jgi:hypothetical protein
MTLDLTDEETAALTRLLVSTIDADRYPLIAAHSDLEGDSRKDPTAAEARAFAAAEALRAAARHSGQKASGGALALKSGPGRPATLGSSAPAGVRLIVWCRDCRHRVEPDPAEQAQRYGAEMTVPEWRDRLVCSKCGSREIDMVVTGTERRA